MFIAHETILFPITKTHISCLEFDDYLLMLRNYLRKRDNILYANLINIYV